MRQRRPIYLKQWRKFLGLTLKKLAERMHMDHSTLSKMERGLLPYGQDFLERVAEELGCDPVDILIRDPTDPEGIWSIWDRVKTADKDTAKRILEQIAEKKNDRKAG